MKVNNTLAILAQSSKKAKRSNDPLSSALVRLYLQYRVLPRTGQYKTDIDIMQKAQGRATTEECNTPQKGKAYLILRR